jgi:hypothetical protein
VQAANTTDEANITVEANMTELPANRPCSGQVQAANTTDKANSSEPLAKLNNLEAFVEEMKKNTDRLTKMLWTLSNHVQSSWLMRPAKEVRKATDRSIQEVAGAIRDSWSQEKRGDVGKVQKTLQKWVSRVIETVGCVEDDTMEAIINKFLRASDEEWQIAMKNVEKSFPVGDRHHIKWEDSSPHDKITVVGTDGAWILQYVPIDRRCDVFTIRLKYVGAESFTDSGIRPNERSLYQKNDKEVVLPHELRAIEAGGLQIVNAVLSTLRARPFLCNLLKFAWMREKIDKALNDHYNLVRIRHLSRVLGDQRQKRRTLIANGKLDPKNLQLAKDEAEVLTPFKKAIWRCHEKKIGAPLTGFLMNCLCRMLDYRRMVKSVREDHDNAKRNLQIAERKRAEAYDHYDEMEGNDNIATGNLTNAEEELIEAKAKASERSTFENLRAFYEAVSWNYEAKKDAERAKKNYQQAYEVYIRAQEDVAVAEKEVNDCAASVQSGDYGGDALARTPFFRVSCGEKRFALLQDPPNSRLFITYKAPIKRNREGNFVTPNASKLICMPWTQLPNLDYIENFSNVVFTVYDLQRMENFLEMHKAVISSVLEYFPVINATEAINTITVHRE